MAEQLDTIVIGGGQAGLAMGHGLAERGRHYVILDASQRIGDAWRHRWDSLVLSTPRSYSVLPGLAMPGNPNGYPAKDEMAEYLERYAAHVALPTQLHSLVCALERTGDGFRVRTDDTAMEARTVVIATSAFQVPAIPRIADLFSSEVRQFTPASYKNPSGFP